MPQAPQQAAQGPAASNAADLMGQLPPDQASLFAAMLQGQQPPAQQG
jgi:hypothetical protein